MKGSDLKNLLNNFVARKKDAQNESEREDPDGIKEFTRLYEKWKGVACDDKEIVPSLITQLPTEKEPLQQKLREESRALFLQRRSQELLDNDELQKLWFLLDKYHTLPLHRDEQMITYRDFQVVASDAGVKYKPFFTTTVFGKLVQDDPFGRISIMHFFNYVMRKVWMYQTRIGLSLYDVTGQGNLKETDLENYIFELIPTLPQLRNLEASFYNFYVCAAVRKFFFFLDPLRTGRVKIQDILACSFLDDLLELRDEELSKELQDSNWFSGSSALRVYGQYLNLDKDRNGMLSKQELGRYGTGTLSDVFLERVYQECLTYTGEMDYKTYLDFVLAMENRREPQALRYLFRILDVQHKGYLNMFDLNYFFKDIQQEMRDRGQEPVSFQDVKDEIFDMIKPADPLKITLQDMIKSGNGQTMVGILIDLNDFWSYENRECLAPEGSDKDPETSEKDKGGAAS